MGSELQADSKRLVVLIDAENANAELIDSLLKEIAKYGTAHVKRIYGDWTTSQLNKWKEKLHKFAIQPIQQFRYTTGKNATDSALIIDAMDLLYTGNFDGFCIVSSDSDFTRLAGRIRESGLVVYGFGEKKTPAAFISACDRFIYTEILGKLDLSKPESDTSDQSKSASEINEEINEKALPPQLSDQDGSRSKQTLKLNKKLVDLLKDAYEAVAEEDGWANLGPFGSQLTKLSSSFDSRNYGYKKLGDFIRASNMFEVRETPHGKRPTAKEIHIRLKT